jgi:hypothetical protein
VTDFKYVLQIEKLYQLIAACHLLNVHGVSKARLEILTVVLLKNQVFREGKMSSGSILTQQHSVTSQKDFNLQVLMTSGKMKYLNASLIII